MLTKNWFRITADLNITKQLTHTQHTCKENMSSRSTNIEKLCNLVGIDRDYEALRTHMDVARKAPFRKEDLSNACKGAGIHVTTDMNKPEIVDLVMDALRHQDKTGNAVYSAIRSNLKEAKPKATSDQNQIIDDAIRKLNALKVATPAAAAAATSAKSKAKATLKPAVSSSSSSSYLRR